MKSTVNLTALVATGLLVALMVVGVPGLNGRATAQGRVESAPEVSIPVSQDSVSEGVSAIGLIAVSRSLQTADPAGSAVRVVSYGVVYQVDGVAQASHFGLREVSGTSAEAVECGSFTMPQSSEGGDMGRMKRSHSSVRPVEGKTWSEVRSPEDVRIELIHDRT